MAIKNVEIRILKSCYIEKTVRKIGAVVTVPEPQARELCWMKKAELVKPVPDKAPGAGNAGIGEGDKTKKGGKVE